MFELDLGNQVPRYGKDNPNWGGPAVVQMAMNGYPQGATSCYIDQTTIWNYIQANNQEGGTGSWGIGWYSDPYAVTKALNVLCPPNGQWHDVSNTDKFQVLYTLLRWMASYKYPSPICFSAHDEWALLIDYITTDDPRQVANTTLERIGYIIPGQYYENSPGDLFLTGPYRWGLPCDGSTCGQKWNNKYVGIGEPPDNLGKVHAEHILRTGTNLIGPKEATEIAKIILAEMRGRKSSILLKSFIDIKAGQPLLVKELPINVNAKAKTIGEILYYIVPFQQKYEISSMEERLTRLSILVNAYTGRYEGLTVFNRPVQYIQRKEALKIATKNLNLKRIDESRITADLVFKPLVSYVTSALPAWRLTVGEREIFVTQNAIAFGSLNFRLYKGA